MLMHLCLFSSPPGSLLRSASFHGTEGMGVAGRWPRRPNHLYTSEDDGPCSLEEEVRSCLYLFPKMFLVVVRLIA